MDKAVYGLSIKNNNEILFFLFSKRKYSRLYNLDIRLWKNSSKHSGVIRETDQKKLLNIIYIDLSNDIITQNVADRPVIF